MKSILLGSFYLVSILLFTQCNQSDNVQNGFAQFELLTSANTGIDFQNTLTEGLNTNILMYEYFYNGGGVAAGDFNGDDLIDLYFTANMEHNKLYLNQGGLAFAEYGQLSGVTGRPGPWKTGVTAVDINGDKRMDLYVCYSGSLPPQKRQNQLFINLGNDQNNVPKFEDQAAQYGLNSPAFSNQGYFFDYDRDGDLDMILLNHNPKSLPILNEVNSAKMLQQDDPIQGVRLFQQNNGKFDDVTRKVGVSGSALTYGLGIAIADFDMDGWPDFYVCNDYSVPDYLYINQKDGTFNDELQFRMGHSSHFSMGNDAGDLNNDGWTDLISLDMLPEDNKRQKLLMAPDNYAKFDLNVRSGFGHQYMRNMLQLNNGNGTFSEIGQLAGISNTDWSWSALIADYDNDSWKDLYVTNGYYRDYTNLDFINYMDNYVQQKGRLKREDVLEIIAEMPSSDVMNYMFSNQNGQGFRNATSSWKMDLPSNSNGAAYADLDNDGDLDLIVNNINQTAFVFKNNAESTDQNYLQIVLDGSGLNSQGIGSRITLFASDQTFTQEWFPARGYLSSVSPVLHFGLGKIKVIDSLYADWPDGTHQRLYSIQSNQKLKLNQNNADQQTSIKRNQEVIFRKENPLVDFEHPLQDITDFERQPLLICAYSNVGPYMQSGDLNGDGQDDLVIGGSKNQATSVYLTNVEGDLVQSNTGMEADAQYVDGKIDIIDLNNDGFKDVFISSSGYHTFTPDDDLLIDRVYMNDGTGKLDRKTSFPALKVSTGAVAFEDINQDGAMDLFVGGRVIPGRFPESPNSHLLINDGNGNFSDGTDEICPELSQIGMVTDAVWHDINGDHLPDLIIVGEWIPISIFLNEDGQLKNSTNDYFDKDYTGWWNTLHISDLNDDNLPDLVVGNVGINTQFKISDANPAQLYYDDFDRNGSIDPFFCFDIQGTTYPYLTRDELGRQLTNFKSRFTSFESYSEVTMNDLFTKRELKQTKKLEANHMETSFFRMTTDNKFVLMPLPVEVQYAPTTTITELDYNQDGIKDLLLCGNNSHYKLQLGRADANYGLLLKGLGNGKFEYIKQPDSGLDIRGDVKCVVPFGREYLFGINQGMLLTYSLNTTNETELLK